MHTMKQYEIKIEELINNLTAKDRRLFAVWCAREALKFNANPDRRSINACDVAERFALGSATNEELAAAKAAAWEAEGAAARAAAWATEGDEGASIAAAAWAAGAAGGAAKAAAYASGDNPDDERDDAMAVARAAQLGKLLVEQVS